MTNIQIVLFVLILVLNVVCLVNQAFAWRLALKNRRRKYAREKAQKEDLERTEKLREKIKSWTPEQRDEFARLQCRMAESEWHAIIRN